MSFSLNWEQVIGGNSHTSEEGFVCRLGSQLSPVWCKQTVSPESPAVPIFPPLPADEPEDTGN